jgi:hypothetical protein
MSACRYCQQEDAVPIRGTLRLIWCSSACRTKERRGRRESSQRRQEQYVVTRLAMARTDADRAQVFWDALRALIHRLRPAEQEAAWRYVAEHLQTISTSIDERRA